MEKHSLFEVLFSVNPLPSELNNDINRNEFISFINAKVKSSNHPRLHDLLLRPGQIANVLYFVEKGLVRAYYKDKYEDKENTIFMWDEKCIVTDHSSFFQRQPSEIYIEVIKGSELLFITHDTLQEMYSIFPYSERYINCIIGSHSTNLSRRINELISLTAWDRYLNLLKTYHKIEQKVSKDVIASFIGITRPSLSRLIKEKGHP